MTLPQRWSRSVTFSRDGWLRRSQIPSTGPRTWQSAGALRTHLVQLSFDFPTFGLPRFPELTRLLSSARGRQRGGDFLAEGRNLNLVEFQPRFEVADPQSAVDVVQIIPWPVHGP